MSWSSPWASWIGWTLGYAVAVWVFYVMLALLERPLAGLGLAELGQWARFLIPLGLAFLIGIVLRSWSWIFGPPLAMLLTMLTYPIIDFLSRSPSARQEVGSGLVIAIFGVSVDALFAALAAAAGVAIGKWIVGR